MTEPAQHWQERFGLPAAVAEHLAEGYAALGHPPEAEQALAHLLERMADAGVSSTCLQAPHAAIALVRLSYAAPFLLRTLAGRPGALESQVLGSLDAGDALLPWQAYAQPAAAADLPEADFMAALRVWKYDNYARLTARELLGLHPTRTTCRRIAELADGMVRLAHGYAFASHVRRYGMPYTKAGDPAWGGVLGMGKLGGRELNYASDIDLIFVQEGDDGLCRKPAEADRLAAPALDVGDDAEEAAWTHWRGQAGEAAAAATSDTTGFDLYNRVARQVVRLVSASQGEGFGFRVDCDLRPNGRSGFLAPNIAFMEQYYLEQGREWERTAMLKARMVAGPQALAERFAAMIRPFVYRRYLDYSALEGVAIVKHDIDRVNRASLQVNLKLGHGGIRENEFLVQAMQLLYGGKRPELQVTGHEAAVDKLAEVGLLSAEEAESIRADYWCLRSVENRVQMVAEAQTHDLPQEPAERTRVLHDFAPGFADRQAEAEAALHEARSRTGDRFQALFAGLGDQGFPDTDAWRRDVQAHLPEADRPVVLERLDSLFAGLMDTRAGERCVFKLAKLLSRPEVYAQGTAAALPRWLDFVEQIGNRNAIFTLIEAHPPIVPWISHIFAEGGRHAERLIRHPEFLESFFALRDAWQHITDRVSDIASKARDEEEFILEVQTAKAQGVIRVLTTYLNEPEGTAHRQMLSDLADATVTAAVRTAWRQLCGRLGVPSAPGADEETVAGFAVLAMGKLGSREMRFSSDLDLVFVFGEEGATSTGRSHTEFYTKLAQRVGTLLTAPTQFGRLYELDHRLRPFGSKGVLVPSLAAYESYLQPDASAGADVWNFQAFTRIRPVCGDASLATSLIGLIGDAWHRRAVSPGAVARQVWDMLGRLVAQAESERRTTGPVVPLKFSVGGLIGYEFLAQAHFLCTLAGAAAGTGTWTAPPPHAIMDTLRGTYESLGALDERLSFYEDDGRHELRSEHCEQLAAIGERWRFAEVQERCAHMAREIEAAFRAWSA